jgi:hypothetical protein
VSIGPTLEQIAEQDGGAIAVASSLARGLELERLTPVSGKTVLAAPGRRSVPWFLRQIAKCHERQNLDSSDKIDEPEEDVKPDTNEIPQALSRSKALTRLQASQ